VADRLLLVEDDPRIRTALGLGPVDQATRSSRPLREAALKLIKQDDFDVVLSTSSCRGWTACRRT
jgi:hypothetical protein